MGGHGGLNILPQKRWNVYNFDNREKVRKDEEAAAREEQLKREQSRRRDLELRLEKLRQSRNPNRNPSLNPNPSSPNSNHINLFKEEKEEDNSKKRKRDEKEKAKEKVVLTAEDEKYRLGYGLVGKGVKLPWYMAKARVFDDDEEDKRAEVRVDNGSEKKTKSGGKKSIEELREERMRRETKEKERERSLIRDSKRGKEMDIGFSRRRM